jgi:hypothetical protein
MKTQSSLTMQNLLTVIKSLPKQLPPDSPIAKQLEEQTQQWLSTLMAALACLDDAESEQLRQQIKPFLLNRSQAPAPVPVEIKKKTTTNTKTTKTTKATKATKTPYDEQPTIRIKDELSKTALVQPPPLSKPGINEILWQKLAGPNAIFPEYPTDQLAELCRWYSWRLANARTVKEIQDYVKHWKKPPRKQPQPNDIVIYGLVPAEINKQIRSPLWISEASLFPEFAHYFEGHHNAQVWLTFQEPVESYQSPEQFQWFNEHPDTLALLHRWHDLRQWAILAPDAAVFINNRYERLNQQREVICDMLNKIQRNFMDTLQQQDKYVYIGEHLHLIYSAFYQFLLPQDVASKYPEYLFAALRTAANNNLFQWLKHLNIEELHRAGSPKKPEYVATVLNDSDRNISISRSNLLISGTELFEESKVLYWSRPKWKQNNPPRNQRAELLGSVLYCFD